MKKRTRIQTVLAAIFVCAAVSLLVALAPGWASNQEPETVDSGSAKAAATDNRPEVVNVIIFLIDTMRADRLGAYGYRRHRTSPNIDSLAQHGVTFETAYAPGPWTLPSVASMFCSTFPCEHKVLSKKNRLSDSADTLAERLKRIGYTTYSLYGNAFIGPKFGMHQGFDFHRGSQRNGGEKASAALGPSPPQPFFFYIHNQEPHNPYHFAPPSTPGFRSVSKERRKEMDVNFRGFKRAKGFDFRNGNPPGTTDLTDELDGRLRALNEMKSDWSELYDASVHLADSRVGSMVEMLKARGFWDNTMFILVSDHGEAMGEHGGWLHDHVVYDEVMRVPLIIRFPGDRYAGRRVKGVASLVDVLPTICDYLGHTDLAAGARGQSLMPLVRGAALQHEEIFAVPGMRHNVGQYYRRWNEARGNINIVIRRDRWKGIWNVDRDTFELYDLNADPLEQSNVASENPKLVEAMRGYLKTWYEHQSQSPDEAEEVGELDEETLQNLRELGYVE